MTNIMHSSLFSPKITLLRTLPRSRQSKNWHVQSISSSSIPSGGAEGHLQSLLGGHPACLLALRRELASFSSILRELKHKSLPIRERSKWRFLPVFFR